MPLSAYGGHDASCTTGYITGRAKKLQDLGFMINDLGSWVSREIILNSQQGIRLYVSPCWF